MVGSQERKALWKGRQEVGVPTLLVLPDDFKRHLGTSLIRLVLTLSSASHIGSGPLGLGRHVPAPRDSESGVALTI